MRNVSPKSIVCHLFQVMQKKFLPMLSTVANACVKALGKGPPDDTKFTEISGKAFNSRTNDRDRVTFDQVRERRKKSGCHRIQS